VSVEVDQERRESRTRFSEAQKVVCAHPPPHRDVFQRLLLPNMNREEETRRERRARLTEAEKMAMRVYADGLEWSLRGHDKDEMSDFCSGIGITVPRFKAWMRNNKNKYYVPDVETSVGETSYGAGPM
jgi:ZF-HD class homeobox domain-containing protein